VLLVVGRIGRAHGVHGEATIEIRTDLPQERFYTGAILTTDPAVRGPLTIEGLRDNNGIMLLKFKEANDRTAIEKLRDTLLLAEVDMAQEAAFEDEYHVQQLIGSSVVDIDGVELGTLTDVLNLPGQDVLAIATARGEALLPFVLEFVPTIDLEAKQIVITPPAGLFELLDSKDEKPDED
jgi:16S rRNA processing protein RimM